MKALRLAYKLNHFYRRGEKQEYPVSDLRSYTKMFDYLIIFR